MDGHLSIYVDDGEMVYRLLPYDDMPTTITVKVKADKPYIFFSPANEHNYFKNHVNG